MGQYFPKLGYFLPIFKKGRGNLPPSPFLVARLSYLIFLKKLIQHYFCLHDNVQIQQKFTFDFKKSSLTCLVAAIYVQLIVTETDIVCGHTRTTLHACNVNRSRKIITFFHLNFKRQR